MRTRQDGDDRVSLMTLHAAKGLEFDAVFLPGWEEGLFPHQRSLDESGEAGLEEERRLAYVGLTRARRQAKVSFAQNRRNRGLWQAAAPSRFVDELPEANVEVIERKSPYGGSGGGAAGSTPTAAAASTSRPAGFQSGYTTPGWQRAKEQRQPRGPRRQAARAPMTLEGELVASSTEPGSGYALGERVFHEKFGYGEVAEVDGNKLTIDFDKAGRKRVVDSFVSHAN